MMIQFVDDEDGYLRWLDDHPEGFVVNSDRVPTAKYLVLHHSGCYSISRISRHPFGNYTTTSYIKTCSDDVTELRRWAQGLRGQLRESCYCLRAN